MPTLLVHQGAIGDLLLSLPTFRLIKKYKGDFTLAGNPEFCLFLKGAGEVSSVLPTTATGFAELYSGVIPPMLLYFDDIWWFTRRRGLIPTILMMPDSDKKAKALFTVDEGPDETNCSLFQFEQAKKILEADENEKLVDYLWPLKYSLPEDQRGPFHLAIQPGSGSPKKNPSIEVFFMIARHLLDQFQKLNILFILGPSEKDMVKPVEDFALKADGRVKILKDQPLEIVAQTLGATPIFIGNDSGISHLASWCGAKTFMLFGPTNPKLWAPQLENCKVIKSKAKCSPCGEKYRRCEEVICMDELDPYGILNEIQNRLNELGLD